MSEWMSGSRPADGTWCWVTDGDVVWLAGSFHSASNGWSNEDTWEDFDSDVIAWIPLYEPKPLRSE